jgi:cation:H+ antiporter
MLSQILLLILGFILLIKVSDIFVDALTSIATNFKMSKMLIALTLAAFGTCAPELSISFTSIIKGNGNIVLGNVLGSCIINVLLIIGIAAIFNPIKIKNITVKKEIPFLFYMTLFFAISLFGNLVNRESAYTLTRADGLIFLLFFIAFLIYLVSLSKLNPVNETEKPKYNMPKSIIISIICIVFIIIGSDLVVDNAVLIAKALNISEKFITMTIVVIGTSLPELTMTVIAAKKKEFDIAIGNIIGTNIFNIGVVLGLPILIYGGIISSSFHLIDVIALFISIFLLYIFSRNDRVISKKEGILMFLAFIIYYSYLAIF